MATDYYAVLGVARDATSQDIKKAFRQIARECHPDVSGGDPEAEERFKTARIAYETLMDPVTRARYDRRGQRRSAMGRGGSFFDAFYKASGERRPNGGGTGGPPPGFDPGQKRAARNKAHDPRNDIGLDDLFNVGDFGFGAGPAGPNSGATGRTSRPPPPPRNRPTSGRDVEIELQVPTDVAQRGGSITAVYHRMQRADSWRPGTDDPGLVRVQDIADIRVVPGTRQGAILREKGLGDAGAFGGAYGDLVARVVLVGGARPSPPPSAPPPRASSGPTPQRHAGPSAFRSDPGPPAPPPVAPDATPLEISVVEALLGGRVALDTPQGKVRLTIPPGTSGGTRLRLKGKGRPLPGGGHADLFVETRIVVPKDLDAESRRLIEEFAKLNP